MTRFPDFGHYFPVLEHTFPVLERLFPVLERLFPVLELPFPVFWFFWEGYFVPGRDGTEEFVPGQRDNGTSRGNPSVDSYALVSALKRN